jgi:hypothetical protein
MYFIERGSRVETPVSSICMVPISKINCRPIGKPVPGPITKMLLSAWSEKVDVDIVGSALSHIRE